MRTALRLVPAGAVLALVLTVGLASTAAAQGGCSLTVSPRSGGPGTQFVFTGTGFTATQLTLTSGGRSRTVPLDLGDADPFEVRFIATRDDAGRWRVVAEGCDDPASFRVTLPSTAAPATVAPVDADRTPTIAAFGLLGVLFVAASWLLTAPLGRRLRVR